MPKTFTQWTVLPHGKLTRLEDDLLSVVGELHMPMVEFPRRMTVVRLHDGRLVVYSAIALDDQEMRALERYGTPTFLIVPNDIHRMDARIWKDRYPDIQVVTPPGSRAKVEEVVPVDSTAIDFGDRNVRFLTVPGTHDREAAVELKTRRGTTLIVNDIVWNVESLRGVGGWLFKQLGLTNAEPVIPSIVRMRGVSDKQALAEQLEAWSQIEDLERIIVSHGNIVTKDPGGALSRLAHDLAA